MIVAFHGEPSLKAAVMDRLREHRRLDQIIQGTYFKRGRGCHLGCLTHVNSNTHETAERLFGIEQRVGYWLEAVFEGLPQTDCAAWVLESMAAIPCGADLSRCHNHFCAWLLGDSCLLTITDGNRAAIERVRRMHERAAAGETISDGEWSAALSAARSACSAACSAEFAACSAACSAALSAAESAARSAWSAACSAELAACSAACSAALSAAESAAAWQKIAAKSIEIFVSAPVVQSPPIEPCVAGELCERKLWCRDSAVLV